MSSLNSFIAAVAGDGLARPNRFAVNIPFPVISGDPRIITVLCDSVTMPGINLNTTIQKQWGEQREIPFEAAYDAVTMSFYVTKNLDVKNLFEQWLTLIRDPVTRSFGYYGSYIVDMDILVYPRDSDENPVHQVILHEAYPKTLASVQLDYASTGVMKYTVSMMYKYYTTRVFDGAAPTLSVPQLNQDPLNITTGLGYPTNIGPADSSTIINTDSVY